MSQNYIANPYMNTMQPAMANPNAVSINIYSPAAYGNGAVSNPAQQNSNGFYSLYGQNPANMYYPMNYNNMIQQPAYNTYNQYPQNQPYQQPIQQGPQAPQNYMPQQNQDVNPVPYNQNQQNQQIPLNSQHGLMPDKQNDSLQNQSANNMQNDKTSSATSETNSTSKTESKDEKKDTKKTIVPLTNEYIMSLENYLNDSNPKIRLIAAKEIMQRFKEDDNRKDNKSLVPLLNKTLQDTSPSVRFLGLTTLQLGYSVGDDTTVAILKNIASKKDTKMSEDQVLASEILLKMSGGQQIEVKKG